MRRTAVNGLLRAGELLYRLGLQMVYAGYRSGLLRTHRLPVPVVSVGNLTWGGTGKTPLVIHLALALKSKGFRVAVLTRGYGEDESLLLQKRLDPIPVLVGADRVGTGRRAVQEFAADLLLLDDGYQQWRLHKDVEILTADARAPFGNGHLIPLGNLREPRAAAARAHVVVVKRSGRAPAQQMELLRGEVRRLNPSAPLFLMSYRPSRIWRWPDGQEVPLKALKGEKVCTLAGIADPGPFEELVGSLGARTALRYRVRDHHPYTAGELMRLMTRCRRHGIESIVTTAKDAVRIPGLFLETVGPELRGMRILVLEVGPVFEPNENELLHRIGSLLAG